MTKKISKNMTFSELLEEVPEAAEVLFEAGMHCVGCPMSAGESIEQGCQAHGMDSKEVNELMKRLKGLKK